MAPGNNERHPNHTGTIPKTKVRNNCNVPQEAVTPTRRDNMTTNLVTTSLDWVPVSEYNTRTNYNQSRKPSNNASSDQELNDLDNSVTFESGFGRFVPVRPQPRALPLNVQTRDNITIEQHDDGASSSISGHTLHPYAHQMQNGLIPHSNHAAAAVMIVNPTTPNAVTGGVSQSFNAPSQQQNRNNLTRNLNSSRNHFDSNSHNITVSPITNSKSGTKTVNLINNMYEQGQGSFNNINENAHSHRDSARALGEAIVASCPDAAAVERRLGQIREYIRVTSSLVDTMRNSEDEAYIEHTKEEYDELIGMIMKLKESETKLEEILLEKRPDNVEVPAEEMDAVSPPSESVEITDITNLQDGMCEEIQDKTCNVNKNSECGLISNTLKKVTNIENEQINKSIQNIKADEESILDAHKSNDIHSDHLSSEEINTLVPVENLVAIEESTANNNVQTSASLAQSGTNSDDQLLNDVLRKNILSCVEKVAKIEEMKIKKNDDKTRDDQEGVTRPVSAQSNASGYSDNELWEHGIKNKVEMTQKRLAALKQQQKRLIKYQEEAKQQLEEINRKRQTQEIQPLTHSHDNFGALQNQNFSTNYQNSNRMFAANQIGVATTLPHSSEPFHGQQNMSNNIDNEHINSAHSNHSQDDRFSHRDANIASSEDAACGGRSEAEDDDMALNETGRVLQMKLRELQMKKQHMESLMSEFQKLQMASHLPSTHNTYSSSGEDSGDEEPARKCNKSGVNIKNEDPFKLMEIKAIKTALQKTKDLMRSVENYETEHLSGNNDDGFRDAPVHSNIHDNKSEGGGSMGGWSNDGSMCRVRNPLQQRHKFTNEQHSQQQQQQLQQQHHQQLQYNLQQQQQQQLLQQHQQQLQQHQQLQQQQQSHEANIASLQELAQELRMETEKVMGKCARIKDMVSNQEVGPKQKKVNEEAQAGPSGVPGPAERRQLQLRALLADKQRELEALLNKQKILCPEQEDGKQKSESQTASIVNQSYNSEQEEPDSQLEQRLLDSRNSRETDNFRGGGDSASRGGSLAAGPSLLGSAYATDSDSASRNKSNQRNRPRRRPTQEKQPEDIGMVQTNNMNQNARAEPRPESSNVNMVPPTTQNTDNSGNVPYPHLPPPPCWNSTKSNQDMRTNQFTQNSHSQTMERLMGTPQMSFPPSMPFNMMMPYGLVGGCGCACGVWGAWCWQQLLLQQRDVHQLREQLAHLEERWRAETVSHTLNNQVPPGNRANNYWDNFRSYSRQNLLSANNKANADGYLGAGPPHNPQPLVERSHNTLHQSTSATSPSITPKRNTNAASSSQNAQHHSQVNTEDSLNRHTRRNVSYERSLSFSSAPDVLNVNQNPEAEQGASSSHSRNIDDSTSASTSNININRQEPTSNSFRNLNIANPIPEIIQSHSNNLNSTANSKRKSSSKLPAKNSTNRRNFTLDYSQTSNINIASTSEDVNPNLASTSREVQDKSTSKLFDLLRENVYSEVTALIGINESHPDFLIQLFRELQLISSDNLRQRVLQSLRNILSQYNPDNTEHQTSEANIDHRQEVVSTTAPEMSNHDSASRSGQSQQSGTSSNLTIDSRVVRFLLMRSDDIVTPDFIEALAFQITNNCSDSRYAQRVKRRLLDFLSKYHGMRVCDVSSDIIESFPHYTSASDENEQPQHSNELSESLIMQDVAGSLNLFSSSDSQLHQVKACPYEMWPGHVHVDVDNSEGNDNSPRSSQEGKVDLINCSEMHNGDLAEADQSCQVEMDEASHEGAGAEGLPDVVDTEEATPTEAEAEWLGLDRVPTRLHMEESSEKQKE